MLSKIEFNAVLYSSRFRNFYKANPRPDALMKEQIVEMSGLSPRVIRVWFQNKRCKDKKNQIKMELQQERVSFDCFTKILRANFSTMIYSRYINYSFLFLQDRFKLGYNSSHGIKLVAHSPVRPMSPSMGQGIDVTHYQPPWQALTEFAMNPRNDNVDACSSPDFKRLFHEVKYSQLQWKLFDLQ